MTFTLRYGVKDIEKAKNLLLASAVEDGLEKARVIAKAANVELGEVLDINYGWHDINFDSDYYEPGIALRSPKLRPACSPSYDIDIEPEDIKRAEEVSLIVSIK